MLTLSPATSPENYNLLPFLVTLSCSNFRLSSHFHYIFHLCKFDLEAVVWRCSVGKAFLKITQNSWENSQDSGTGVFLLILRNF